ncbi:hypothetical protein PoMZ_13582 [Pyricularia oryzae]|uniref:Uncharacterized protein n=1 Tax=Pyricularia oryzae TaxID=318829 RepID=A0A4P7NVT5_PYROR|nr:hypothetical protein PoMZ_13582 [Pyricularia oryzae]
MPPISKTRQNKMRWHTSSSSGSLGFWRSSRSANACSPRFISSRPFILKTGLCALRGYIILFRLSLLVYLT